MYLFLFLSVIFSVTIALALCVRTVALDQPMPQFQTQVVVGALWVSLSVAVVLPATVLVKDAWRALAVTSP
ncbi:hypothetical protein [Asanoa iriomotensis]|uniref:Uncharacterized protein n=1 Tax=Asanoa iriomotensis TaxID=234613 RepID=A0ABQ4CBN6_9ACTN|nr:hypothetical protein [Asanoa iriomotensis]GIF60185.1 hypothetical protein Air01nite_62800 [Asanoa iriomotensis]